jgi:hypothetical protein
MPIHDDSRAAWGARPNNNPRRIAPADRLGISWHYDGGSPLNLAKQHHSACLDRVKADQVFHMDSRGWADIGYNLLVCQHGRVIEGRGADLQGAHSPGVNATHYGVQFMVGGTESPTPAAWTRAADLAAQLRAHSGRSLRSWGHKDDPKASTECPGSVIEAWAKRLGSSTPMTPTPTTGGQLTMSDINTLTDKLDAVLVAVQGLRSEEAGRYKVDADRYAVESRRYQQLLEMVTTIALGLHNSDGAITPEAIAAAIPSELAAQVADELGKRLQVGGASA